MASKMAVSKAPKTYMIHILDQKHLYFGFYGCLEAKLYKDLKWGIAFIKKAEMFRMASKMAVSYASKTYMTNILDKTF